jgi:hypothetical protein
MQFYLILIFYIPKPLCHLPTISNLTTNYGLAAFTTIKMIDWLTKQISKCESLVNNNKEINETEEQ